MNDERNVTLTLYNSLVKIFPKGGAAIAVGGEDSSAEELFSATMLQNETFSFQTDVFLEETTRLFNTFRFTAEGLPKGCISVFEEDCVPVSRASYPEADEYRVGEEYGIFPDVLTPYGQNAAFVMHADRHKAFWIKISGNLPVGRHEITLTLNDYERVKLVEKRLIIEVKAAALPKTDLLVTNWLHCDCICEQYRVKPFSRRFYKILREYLRSLVSHGNNTLYTPLFTPALDTDVGGERYTVQLVGVTKTNEGYSFDFSELGKFFAVAKEEGIERFEFCHLFTQWGAEHAPKIMANVNGKNKRVFGWETDSLGEEYADFLRQFLPQLTAFAKEREIDAVFHLSDEPGETNDRYEKVCALVRPYIGDYKIVDACGKHFQERGLTDLSFVGISDDEEVNEKSYGQENCRVAAYYCCGQHKGYVTNRFMVTPPLRNRILGVQLYLSKAAGFLHWGYNFYHSASSRDVIDPFLITDGKGAYPAGDCFIVYPDVRADGVIESTRNEVFSEGLQDYRLMLLLEKKYGRAFVEEKLLSFGVKGFTTYPKSEKKFNAFIEEMKALV